VLDCAVFSPRVTCIDVSVCQVNGENVLKFEYDSDVHSETVYDSTDNELLELHFDAADRLTRVSPRIHLDALNVSYDQQGRWTDWSRGDLTVRRVFDEPSGRLVERRLGSRTGCRYVYKNSTSKASRLTPSFYLSVVYRTTVFDLGSAEGSPRCS